MIRVGSGIDVHAFGPGDHVMLGGVRLAHTQGVRAHSDGDVLLHALCDALLGAAGLGDIGQHYPDTDPAWKGADSLKILADVSAKVRADGWNIGNIDCSVVCESPKIAAHRDTMVTLLSAAVGAPVSVKGRRAEGIGAIGRGEGIMCYASAVLVRQK